MANKGKYYDNTPFIPMAGATTVLEGIGSDQSIRQDLYFKVKTATPPNIVKFRKTIREVPGMKQIHRGIFDDPRDYEDFVHGNKTLSSLHVPDCIKGSDLSGNKYFMNSLSEQLYATSKREPLGKGLMRNYLFPEEVKKDEFRFGIPTTGFYNAKDVIYNGCLLNEPDDVKKRYQKTHGLSDPGEQKLRNYIWNFDKDKHAFGLPQDKEIDGAKKSLRTDELDAPYPLTKIVGKRLEDFRQATSDMLGRPKFKGTLHPNLGPDHMFGLPNKFGAWNAGKCINGDPDEIRPEALLPDSDLGKDVKYKSKLDSLKPIEYGMNKTFGVPSIRTDLPKKAFVSVSDLNNYGNEKDVYELLYPHPCATRGIDDEDFDHLYTKKEIDALLKKYDYAFPPEEFNLIFQVGLKNYPNEEEKISANAFLATMRNLKREFMKYRTLID